MNRYMYYLIFLNMFVSSVGYVPNILFANRLDGSVISILIAPIISGIFIYIFINSLRKFPNKGLPEIFAEQLPKWIGKPLLFSLGIMWLWAAITALLSLVVITLRYINPDIPDIILVIVFTIFIIWIIQLKSTTVLYTLEILLIFSVPFIVMVMFKSYSSNYITWNSVVEATNYLFNAPTWNTLAATTFSFIGYINMVIFNRIFQGKINLIPLLVVLFIGLGTLVTMYIIPIGYLGFDVVQYYTYPWISTTDAMRMEYGVIERVMFLFLMFHFNIAILGMVIHGHVGFELLKGVFTWKKANKRAQKITNWSILLLLGLVILFLKNQYNQQDVFRFGSLFLNIRLAAELLLVLVVFILARRRKS